MQGIKKINLCDQLLTAMIDLIQKGKWKQGERLPGEIELANTFNVSRNIMREALKILENFGVLDAKNGIGTFVSVSAIESIQNMDFFYRLKGNDSVEAILELRLIIEPDAAYFAALRITEDGILHLKQVLAELLQKYKDEQSYQDDFAIHQAIAHYSGNVLLESFCTTLLKQLQNSLYAEFNKYTSAKTKKDNESTHIAILEAIIARKANTARQLMDKHLRRRLKLINPDFELNPGH